MNATAKGYEPSKSMGSFHIRGFQHWDGALVLDRLTPGMQLSLISEPDNPFDSQAIAIYCDDTKLGYVPAERNEMLALLSFYGHANVFEARILQVDKEAEPWNQVRVGIYVTDMR